MHSCGNYKGRARQAGGQSPLGSSLQPLSAQTRLINPSPGDRYVYTDTHTRRHIQKGRRFPAEKPPRSSVRLEIQRNRSPLGVT